MSAASKTVPTYPTKAMMSKIHAINFLLFLLHTYTYIYVCTCASAQGLFALTVNSPPLLVLSRFVLAITKCDLASPESIKAMSEIASKQKKPPPVVEVSSHHAINVSAVVHLAAHYGNQKFGIPKPKVCVCGGGGGRVCVSCWLSCIQ